jgi:hypothetical protein
MGGSGEGRPVCNESLMKISSYSALFDGRMGGNMRAL